MKAEEFKVGCIVDVSKTKKQISQNRNRVGSHIKTAIVINVEDNDSIILKDLYSNTEIWFGAKSRNAEYTKLIAQPRNYTKETIKILYGDKNE